MIRAIDPAPVTIEEMVRRIAFGRRMGFRGRNPAVVVYHPSMRSCPWPDCDYQIAGITFNLDAMAKAAELESWLRAWWLGPGLVGRCPGCGNLVLFDIQWKEMVTEEDPVVGPQLPDDWHTKARLTPADGK